MVRRSIPVKYQAILPERNDNVTDRHPLKEFLTLVGGAAAIVLVIFWLLALFVDLAVDQISPEMEGKLFAKFNLIGHDTPGEHVEQQKLQKRLDSLRHCIDIGYPVKLQLVESEQANALAFPGGRIVLLSGLLDHLHSENGLTFILAHELGHFKNRDHLRAMGRGIVMVALAALVTGANSDFSQTIVQINQFGQARYSRARESDADRLALQALHCHYGHVGGATEFFDVMVQSGQAPDSALSQYLASHPKMQQRIDQLNDLIKKMGYPVEATVPR